MMDLDKLQTLYDTRNDQAKTPEQRQKAAELLASIDADQIVTDYLALPLTPAVKDQDPVFQSYENLYFRNCLDAPHVWDKSLRGGMMRADFSTMPAEADKIGNILFARKRNLRRQQKA